MRPARGARALRVSAWPRSLWPSALCLLDGPGACHTQSQTLSPSATPQAHTFVSPLVL